MASKLTNRLGMEARNARDAYRNIVPQNVRSAVLTSPAGAAYKAAQSSGVGQSRLFTKMSDAFGTGQAMAADTSGGQSMTWQVGGYPNQETWQALADQGYDVYNKTYEQIVADVQGQTPAQATSSGGGGGGGAAAPVVEPELVTYNNVQYDLNNENDRSAYVQVRSGDIDKELTQALKTGNLSYATKLAGIQDQLTSYMRDWESQGRELGAGYNQGMSARQQGYQGLGTRAYQSSMGTSGQYALNKLGEAQNERNYQKGITEKQVAGATTGLEQAYNEWINQTGQTAQRNKDEIRTAVAPLGGFDTSKLGAPILSQSDLSQYTPYTNFQSLAGSPLVANAKTISQAPVSQMTLSEWLQQQTDKSGNPLQQFLQGRA